MERRSIKDILQKWASIYGSSDHHDTEILSVYYIPKGEDERNIASSYQFPHGTFRLAEFQKPSYSYWVWEPHSL